MSMASSRRLVSSGAMSVGAEEVAVRPRLSIVARTLILARTVVTGLWFQALVTMLLVGIVSSQLDWHAVTARIGHGEFRYLASAVALVGLTLLVGAYRWRALLRASGMRLAGAKVVRIYVVAKLSGTFLPTTAGAHPVRRPPISATYCSCGP
jgi:uncharacterized membrane protein YbhN (UPF0104 family)